MSSIGIAQFGIALEVWVQVDKHALWSCTLIESDRIHGNITRSRLHMTSYAILTLEMAHYTQTTISRLKEKHNIHSYINRIYNTIFIEYKIEYLIQKVLTIFATVIEPVLYAINHVLNYTQQIPTLLDGQQYTGSYLFHIH